MLELQDTGKARTGEIRTLSLMIVAPTRWAVAIGLPIREEEWATNSNIRSTATTYNSLLRTMPPSSFIRTTSTSPSRFSKASKQGVVVDTEATVAFKRVLAIVARQRSRLDTSRRPIRIITPCQSTCKNNFRQNTPRPAKIPSSSATSTKPLGCSRKCSQVAAKTPSTKVSLTTGVNECTLVQQLPNSPLLLTSNSSSSMRLVGSPTRMIEAVADTTTRRILSSLHNSRIGKTRGTRG